MVEKREGKPKYSRLRIFCLTSITTFCILFLCAGFVIADYNSRNTGFGDASLRIDVYARNESLNVNFLGREQTIDIPEKVNKWAGRLWNLLPPGFRTAFWILESEYDAVPIILDNIS